MKTQHTPGPWIMDNYARIYGPEHPKSQHRNKREFIAHIIDDAGRHSPHMDNGAINEQGRANAQLIAAAPELLAALVGMLEWAQRVKEQNSGPEVRNAVVAIQKAEPEPTAPDVAEAVAALFPVTCHNCGQDIKEDYERMGDPEPC